MAPTHNSVMLATAPDGKPHIVRSESLDSVGPPFAWSPSIQARTVHLANGGTVIILDTPANMAVIANAFDPSGSSVRPGETTSPATGDVIA